MALYPVAGARLQGSTMAISIPSADEPSRHGSSAVPFLFLGLLWLQLFWALIPSWRFGIYYEYGWLVPPVFLLLFLRRFLRHDSQEGSASRHGLSTSVGAPIVAITSAVGLLLIAVRMVESSAETWRLPLWIHAASISILSHAILAWRYGSPGCLHYLPITLIGLTAVPLPSMAERWIVEHFTASIVEISVGLLPLLGIPADARGFSIVSMGDVVSVSEGCSGIRSLQSLIMISIVCGEIFLLPWARRIILIAVGCAAAVTLNVVRAVVLAAIRFSGGPDAMGEWHDRVGYLSFALSGLLVLAVAWWLDRLANMQASITKLSNRRPHP